MPDWAIVAARLLQFGSAVVLFGLPLFCLYGFSAGEANRLSRRWGRMRLGVLIAAAGAFLGVVWWIAAQAAIFFPDASRMHQAFCFTLRNTKQISWTRGMNAKS